MEVEHIGNVGVAEWRWSVFDTQLQRVYAKYYLLQGFGAKKMNNQIMLDVLFVFTNWVNVAQFNHMGPMCACELSKFNDFNLFTVDNDSQLIIFDQFEFLSLLPSRKKFTGHATRLYFDAAASLKVPPALTSVMHIQYLFWNYAVLTFPVAITFISLSLEMPSQRVSAMTYLRPNTFKGKWRNITSIAALFFAQHLEQP